jgi:hypothetical protein
MIKMAVGLFPTKNSVKRSSEGQTLRLKEEQEPGHPRNLPNCLETSSFQEEPEDLLDFRDSSKSWMITTQDHLINTSSPRP